MKRKLYAALLAGVLLLTGCTAGPGGSSTTTTATPSNPGGTEDIMSIPADAFPSRSDRILYTRKVGQITGQAGFTDTYEKFNVFGTDLGIPYYDETTGRLTLLFGDTYAAANFSGNWRSNVALYTTQTEYRHRLRWRSDHYRPGGQRRCRADHPRRQCHHPATAGR